MTFKKISNLLDRDSDAFSISFDNILLDVSTLSKYVYGNLDGSYRITSTDAKIVLDRLKKCRKILNDIEDEMTEDQSIGLDIQLLIHELERRVER